MEWHARIFGNPPITIIQDDEGRLYVMRWPNPSIYCVAQWIRNRPDVYRMSMPNPMTDIRQTRKYIEYKFAVYPF